MAAVDSFRSARSEPFSIVAGSGPEPLRIETREARVLFAVGAQVTARLPVTCAYWGWVSLGVLRLVSQVANRMLHWKLPVVFWFEVVLLICAPGMALVTCVGQWWRLQTPIAVCTFLYRWMAPFNELNSPSLQEPYSSGQLITEMNLVCVAAIVLGGCMSIPRRLDRLGMALAILYPGFVVATVCSNSTAVLVPDALGPSRASLTIMACMGASVLLNGTSCLLHLWFARQPRPAAPPTLTSSPTSRATWWILAVPCCLTGVADAAVLVWMASVRIAGFPASSALGLAGRVLTDLGMWFITSWLVALPHLATCVLLQGELEHVTAILRSAGDVADLTRAFEACEKCKRRYGCFLTWHFLLDGVSLLTGLAADLLLVFASEQNADKARMLFFNLGQNHPQLTAAFLFMQCLSLVAFHEDVEAVVHRCRQQEDDRMFRTLTLRQPELQLPVMGKVLTRKWFKTAVASAMVSTMISASWNFLKPLLGLK